MKKDIIKTTYFKIVCAILIISSTISITLQNNIFAFAKVDINLSQTNQVGGGSYSSLYIASTHKEEVKNFADVKDFSNDYSYFFIGDYISHYVSAKPSATDNYNDMDTVIYMIGELESLAMDYANNNTQTAINLVLGYIRGINRSYSSDIYLGVGEWSLVCGGIDEGFISYVATHSGDGITFPQFFASFLQNNNYNSDMYGTIDSSFTSKKYLIPDPLGSGQSIDLIHMIASMDGIYAGTGYSSTLCDIGFSDTTFQRDLTSWLGDLQTFTNEIKSIPSDNFYSLQNYPYDNSHIDFNEFVGNGVNSFSASDLLADLDAYNITKFFLDNNQNMLYKSIRGYYNTVNQDSSTAGNRYYEFIYTSTLEIDDNFTLNNSLLSNFQTKVFGYMNLNYNNGSIIDEENYSQSSINFYLMCKQGYPSFEIRRYSAKLFYDYVLCMSNRF